MLAQGWPRAARTRCGGSSGPLLHDPEHPGTITERMRAVPHGDLQALLAPHVTAQGLPRTASQPPGCCSGPQRCAGWWCWWSAFSHHLGPHPLLPLRPRDPIYHTATDHRATVAEQGKGTFLTIRIASSLSLLNPATFALLNLGEYEKHSLGAEREVGEGQAGFWPPLTPCQVLCNSKSVSGMPPRAAQPWPRPSKPGDPVP